MPRRSKKPCCHPGCGRLTVGRFFDWHARDHARAAESRRGSAAARGYGGKWQRVRKAYLAANPLCRICEETDRVTAATVLDHKMPHRLVDGPESVAYHRRVYATWHEGLVRLAMALGANRGRLIKHLVTGPGAPAAPWKAQVSAVPQIVIDRPGENP